MFIFKCDSTIFIINVYETTLTKYTTRYVLEDKLCASVQTSVNLQKGVNHGTVLDTLEFSP